MTNTERASGVEKAIVVGIGLAVGWVFLGASDQLPLARLSSNGQDAVTVSVVAAGPAVSPRAVTTQCVG